MKKIVLISILCILTLFGLLEFISYLYISADDRKFIAEYNKEAAEEGIPLFTQRYAPVQLMRLSIAGESKTGAEKEEDFEDEDEEEEYTDETSSVEEEEEYPIFRKGYTGKPSKGSIVFYGCLYTYGMTENPEDTLPYITGKKSGMTVINRALNGGSPVTMLHDLMHSELYDILKKQNPKAQKPKYIIYTFINDQYKRILSPYRSFIAAKNSLFYDVSPIFIKKDNSFVEIFPSRFKLFLYSLYTTKAYYKFISRDSSRAEEKFNDLIIASKKITDEKFPGSNFVVLMYKDGSGHIISKKNQRKLKSAGIIVLDSEKIAGHELASEKWRLADKEHPNKDAYNDTAKGLIKELGL